MKELGSDCVNKIKALTSVHFFGFLTWTFSLWTDFGFWFYEPGFGGLRESRAHLALDWFGFGLVWFGLVINGFGLVLNIKKRLWWVGESRAHLAGSHQTTRVSSSLQIRF